MHQPHHHHRIEQQRLDGTRQRDVEVGGIRPYRGAVDAIADAREARVAFSFRAGGVSIDVVVSRGARP